VFTFEYKEKVQLVLANIQQVSISSTLYARIFHTKVLFCQNVTEKKLLKRLSYKKCAHKNVDEIDGRWRILWQKSLRLWKWVGHQITWCQFHQHLCTNFLYECCFGSFFYIHVTREKLPKRHLYKKFVRKILMKFKVGLSTITATLCES